MTPGFPYEEMPEGPASRWGQTPERRFLVDLEAVEDAVAQFVNVSIPDLIDAGPGDDIDFLYDRLANTLESLRTAMTALWCARAGM